MHHLPEHINEDIKRRHSKDQDSTVNKTEYRSKRNPTGKPRWAKALYPLLSLFQLRKTEKRPDMTKKC